MQIKQSSVFGWPVCQTDRPQHWRHKTGENFILHLSDTTSKILIRSKQNSGHAGVCWISFPLLILPRLRLLVFNAGQKTYLALMLHGLPRKDNSTKRFGLQNQRNELEKWKTQKWHTQCVCVWGKWKTKKEDGYTVSTPDEGNNK